MSNNPFVLRQKLEDFAASYLALVDGFPIRERQALNSRTRDTVYRMVWLTIDIQKAADKQGLLQKLDRELDFLRFLIREAHTKRYIGKTKRPEIARQTAEIGKILGGMLKGGGVQP